MDGPFNRVLFHHPSPLKKLSPLQWIGHFGNDEQNVCQCTYGKSVNAHQYHVMSLLIASSLPMDNRSIHIQA
jgi:hypothetical protein